MHEELVIIYDGDCPFCSRYVDLVALRAGGIAIRLKSARDGDVLSDYPEAASYNLDQGILARWDGAWLYGAEALSLISTLVERAPAASLLRHQRAARRLYPLLRLGRRAALLLKGSPPIQTGTGVGRGES